MATPVESEKQKFRLRRFLSTIILVCTALFICSAVLVITDHKQFSEWASNDDLKGKRLKTCENMPYGSQTLPRGIVSPTSDLELLPLWGYHQKNYLKKPSKYLLAIAAGIMQKENVNKIVNKFLWSDGCNFVVMLFHYDGLVDGWRDLKWSNKAIHLSAINQTKWWFAKRFLHPDIVSEYEYIFLWDEDLGVNNFDPGSYLTIIKEEGLEISQPALDPSGSEVHHQLTKKQNGSKVHRRIRRKIGGSICDDSSSGPPCSGFVEMMAPVFSKASWRCTWYMIQNDLVQGWGVDYQLGYCAQGDPSKNVGIVDSQYIKHYGIPTLGGSATKIQCLSKQSEERQTVKNWSRIELEIFKDRWKKAAKDDDCWSDPYKQY
ncbi:uncharacterized protein [Euphorbia lathyris]|uniref:uncharacterized protein isoform X2 n=1 Tax=Euphorbia lathyris TaxID=212925 RepID=UPI0033143718